MKKSSWMPLIAILLFTVVFYPRQSMADLVLHYQFENNLLDNSGMGNNGTFVNNGITYTPGIFGQAANFSGVDSDYIQAAHSTSLDLLSGMTLAAWIKPEDPPVANGGIIFKGFINNTPGVYDLLVGSFPNDDERAGASINNGAAIVGLDGAISYSTWQHLATTYDGSDLRLYLNGVEIASTPFAGVITQEVSPLNIGHRYRFGDGIYQGLIDDVRIYNTALSTTQIGALANASTAVPEPSTFILLALGLVSIGGIRYQTYRKSKRTLGGVITL